MTRGKKLYPLRTASKYTLEDVARKGGFSKTLLWRFEHGKSAPRPKTLESVLYGLGVSKNSPDWQEVYAL
ncbi:MAG: helix-turn-helix domain-containing protein [Chthoniobacterales bacterium]